jgi:hypothetical protein
VTGKASRFGMDPKKLFRPCWMLSAISIAAGTVMG